MQDFTLLVDHDGRTAIVWGDYPLVDNLGHPDNTQWVNLRIAMRRIAGMTWDEAEALYDSIGSYEQFCNDVAMGYYGNEQDRHYRGL